jgi:hypothetical protein
LFKRDINTQLSDQIAHTAYRLWRKNRRPNFSTGSSCYGTDLNRNYKFQWMVSQTFSIYHNFFFNIFFMKLSLGCWFKVRIVNKPFKLSQIFQIFEINVIYVATNLALIPMLAQPEIPRSKTKAFRRIFWIPLVNGTHSLRFTATALFGTIFYINILSGKAWIEKQ